VLVLVDTSASMHDKLETVKEALIDLSISLNARIGRNLFSIYRFPGKRKDIERVFDWSPQLDEVTTVFPRLTSGGITPTGPAIRRAMYQFGKRHLLRRFRKNDEEGMEEVLWTIILLPCLLHHFLEKMMKKAWKKYDGPLHPGMHIRGKWNGHRYFIKRKLGQGSIGTVYLCVRNGHEVALKISDKTASITTEINVLKRLNQVQEKRLGPDLLDADDWISPRGITYYFYVMEYVQGESINA